MVTPRLDVWPTVTDGSLGCTKAPAFGARERRCERWKGQRDQRAAVHTSHTNQSAAAQVLSELETEAKDGPWVLFSLVQRR